MKVFLILLNKLSLSCKVSIFSVTKITSVIVIQTRKQSHLYCIIKFAGWYQTKFFFFTYLSLLNDSDHQTNINISLRLPKQIQNAVLVKNYDLIKGKILFKPTWPYVEKKLNLNLNSS